MVSLGWHSENKEYDHSPHAAVEIEARLDLPQDHTKTVDVGGLVVDVACLVEHLGCCPVYAAASHELLRVRLLDLLLEPGETEVGHLDVPLGIEQQVERLEVAMRNACPATETGTSTHQQLTKSKKEKCKGNVPEEWRKYMPFAAWRRIFMRSAMGMSGMSSLWSTSVTYR